MNLAIWCEMILLVSSFVCFCKVVHHGFRIFEPFDDFLGAVASAKALPARRFFRVVAFRSCPEDE